MNELKIYKELLESLPLCELTNISFEELGNESNDRGTLIQGWLDIFSTLDNPYINLNNIIVHYNNVTFDNATNFIYAV